MNARPILLQRPIRQALIATTASAGIGLATLTQAADLEVIVEPIAQAVGTVNVALYAGEDSFRSRSILHGLQAPAQAGQQRFVFRDLPPGEYAVMLFHDRNGNQTLDSNLLGIPNEPWGASLEGRTVFGAPGWNDAKFTLPDGGRSVRVALSR